VGLRSLRDVVVMQQRVINSTSPRGRRTRQEKLEQNRGTLSPPRRKHAVQSNPMSLDRWQGRATAGRGNILILSIDLDPPAAHQHGDSLCQGLPDVVVLVSIGAAGYWLQHARQHRLVRHNLVQSAVRLAHVRRKVCEGVARRRY
jgi:hypothetical protein